MGARGEERGWVMTDREYKTEELGFDVEESGEPPRTFKQVNGASNMGFSKISLEINVKHQSNHIIPLLKLSGTFSPSSASLSNKCIFTLNSASLPL